MHADTRSRDASICLSGEQSGLSIIDGCWWAETERCGEREEDFLCVFEVSCVVSKQVGKRIFKMLILNYRKEVKLYPYLAEITVFYHLLSLKLHLMSEDSLFLVLCLWVSLSH